MITLSESISYESTPTVLEALVREAALIKEYKPKANVEGKDDKSFLYAVITDEDIPRVLAIRGKDIDFKKKITNNTKLKAVHGPFTSGPQLKVALRLIRKIFPFYDTERPVDALGKHGRAKVEFNRQIGQYPRDMDKKEYLRSIRNVSLFLSGKVKTLRATLTKEMSVFAKEERFEEAGRIRRQLFALDHVQDVSLIREEREKESNTPRIEAYDTAHIGGTNAIGVMVVSDGGVVQKKEYRTFTIRGHYGRRTSIDRKNDDIASLKEILSRRFGHTEWTYPKVIVVDGGKTHKKTAENTLLELGIQISVVAVVKDEKHRPREVFGSLRAGITDADAVYVNSEAHRFAITKHRKLRSRSIRP
jgi:excinuclease UvrABC nuclease subunit